MKTPLSSLRPVRLLPPLVMAAIVLGAGNLAIGQTPPNFGPNVTILTPNMTPAQVTAALNAVNNEPQFSVNRHAVLFMPGSYGATSDSVYADVGYYETIAGLGQTPGQVTITGGLVADQLISGNMTQNFWRSEENLSQVPVGGETSGTLDWGVSQGASLRRMNIEGNLRYANVNCNESSGGFTADTAVSGTTNACSQQQWYTRNSVIPPNSWSSYVWNFVFSGVVNAPAQNYPGAAPTIAVTNLATTPVSREKPFLFVDSSNNWNVFVPGLKTNSSGTSWSGGGLGTGQSLPIGSFFIAQPSNSLAQINQALAAGQNLILTPGIYQYAGAINVTRANTVVLGMGYATLVPQTGTAAITVADVDGVQIAGLLIDAGPVNSPVLLEVGNPGGTDNSHASNPTSLNDVFFRIGGATEGTATTSLQVDSGNVILDNIWAWRADHGNAGTVGWTVNTAAHGLVVNGANVTALGLAVEHYQQEQVLWNGTGGETIFYQSELPYDPPSQSAWMDGSANGYPSYVVSPGACSHAAYGFGIYSYFNQGVNIVEDNAMTVPDVSGIKATDVGTVFLGGSGQITHVIDGTGATASAANAGTLVPVPSYVGSGTCTGTQPTPPATPGGLEAVDEPPQESIPTQYVALSWNASATADVTYTIYRGTGSATPVSIQAGVTGTNFNDTTVAESTTYTYYIEAVNSGGSSSHSNEVTLTTMAGEVAPPANLTGTASGSQINLSWTASTTAGVTYTVYRESSANTAAGFQSIANGLKTTTYTDTAVTSGVTYTYDVLAILVTGTGTSQSPQSNTVSVTVGSGGGGGSAGSDVVAIDSGSATAVNNFVADTDVAGGGKYAPGQTVTVPAGLSGAAPAAVYQTAHQGASTYTIGGIKAGGSYTVVLHFAELYFHAASQREFNVAINGTRVLTNFDIYTAAGGHSFTAVVKPFANIVANGSGQIVVSFTNGSVDQPMINGIEVQSGSAAPPPTTAVAIDSGSTTAVNGFVADTDVTGGGTYAPGQTVTVPAGVNGAAPAAVYATAHQGASTYTIPGFTAGGSHTVTLHFAELYFNAAGQRKFNVAINGATVLTDFDIFAAAGNHSFTAVVKPFAGIAANSSGQIVVSLTNGSVDQPMVNGVQVQ